MKCFSHGEMIAKVRGDNILLSSYKAVVPSHAATSRYLLEV